jgi:flavin-dependent dehydrogenase
VFPKDGHASYGVGGWASEGPQLRAHLRRLCREHGINSSELTELPGRRTTEAGRGPVLLVGDAAGLVDPLLGDGLHPAFLSARLAAEAILAGDLAGYPHALDRALGRIAVSSWQAKLVLDRHPRAAFELARLPLVWNVIAGLITGQLGHPDEARGFARVPLRLLARL